jgi:4-carboxymuconolactone decarboxylase
VTTFTRAPRLKRVEREDCPSEWRDAYDHVIKSRGHTKLANVFAFLANSPGAMQAVTAVGEHVRFKTDFDPVLRELVIMTVAQELECVYEWAHHWVVSLKAGASEALLMKLGSAALEAEPMPVGPAVKYARLLTHNQPVDDALVDALKAHFGVAGWVDLTVMIGYYGMLARFINTTGVPVEEGHVKPPFSRAA